MDLWMEASAVTGIFRKKCLRIATIVAATILVAVAMFAGYSGGAAHSELEEPRPEVGMSAGHVQLRQSPRGAETAVRSLPAPAGPLNGIRGLVVDDTQLPVPFATVSVRRSASAAAIATTSADSFGLFAFPELSPAPGWILADAEGFTAASLPLVDDVDHRVVLRMHRNADVSGTVMMPNGTAAVGAVVTAAGPAGTVTTRTGPEGGFALNLPQGQYSVSARLGTLASLLGEKLAISSSEERSGVLIRLSAGAILGGTISDSNGRPLFASVSLLDQDGASELLRTNTAEAGRFRLLAVPPGQFIVRAEAANGAFSQVEGVLLRAEQEVDLDLRLPDSAVVEGTVSDSHARPATNAVIRLTGGDGLMKRATAGADGRFVIAGIPPGRYSVLAGPDDRTSLVQAFVEAKSGGAAQVNLVFPEEAMIRGTVRGERGPPSPTRVLVVASGRPSSLGHRSSAQPDAKGEYQLSVAPGTYVLGAYLKGTGRIGSSDHEYVSLSPGETRVVDIDITDQDDEAPLFQGMVLDGEGRPCSGALVYAASQYRELGPFPTNGDGQFRIFASAAPSGPWSLYARSGGAYAAASDVSPKDSDIVLRLSRPASVAIRLNDLRPRQRHSVVMVQPALAVSSWRNSGPKEFFGPDVELHELVPSRTTFEIIDPDGARGSSSVDLSPGGAEALSIDVRAPSNR